MEWIVGGVVVALGFVGFRFWQGRKRLKDEWARALQDTSNVMNKRLPK